MSGERDPQRDQRSLVAAALQQVEGAQARRSHAGARFLGPDLTGRDWPPGYRIEARVHRGGQGTVYRARRIATDQVVAIKVIDGDAGRGSALARFDREVKVLARLKHPGIVTVQDRGELDQHAYYVMEYVPGDDLDRYLATRTLSMSQRVLLCVKIADAVSAAHRMGVIHRDLKPANIRIDDEGAPRVLDFGLARERSEQQATTRTGAFVGSAPWASPEQVAPGADDLSLATDVYALGVVFYQIFSGRFPYDTTKSLLHTFDQILNAEAIRLSAVQPTIDRDIEAIVHRCLEKKPAHRYTSAAEVAVELRRFQQGLPIEARGQHAWYVLKKRASRYRVAALVTLAFAALLIGFVLQLMRGADRLRDVAERLDAALTARELGDLKDAFGRSDRERVAEILERNRAPDADPLFGLYHAALHRDLGTILLDAPILTATFAADGEVAIGTWNGDIAIADATSGSVLRRWSERLTDVRDITYRAPGGGVPTPAAAAGTLITGGSDGVTWIDSKDGQILRVEPVDTAGVEFVSAGSAIVLAATRDGRVYQFPAEVHAAPRGSAESAESDPLSGSREGRPPARPVLICRHPEHDSKHPSMSGVSTTTLAASCRKVATAGRGVIRIWSIDVPQPLVTVPITRVAFGPQASIGELRLSVDGSRLAIGISNPGAKTGSVVVLDTSDGSSVATVSPRGDIVTALAFLDNDTLLVGDDDGGVWTYDLNDGAEMGHALAAFGVPRKFAVPTSGSTSSAALISRHAMIVTDTPRIAVTEVHACSRIVSSNSIAIRDARLAWIDRQSGRDAGAGRGVIADVTAHARTLEPACTAIAIGEAGLLRVLTDGTIVIDHAEAGDASVQSVIAPRGVTPAAVGWAGNRVVATGIGGAIEIFTRGGRAAGRIESMIERPRAIAGDAKDGSWVAVIDASSDAVLLISLEDPSVQTVVKVPGATFVTFLEPDLRVAVGGADGVITIFDVRRGDPISTLEADLGALQALAFDRSERVLYAVGQHGRVRGFPTAGIPLRGPRTGREPDQAVR